PWTSAAASAVAERGSSTTSAGSPAASQRSRPAGSVRAMAAPRPAAWAANSAPWAVAPGRAHQRSPGSTERESRLTPRRARSSSGAAAPRARASSAAVAPCGWRGRAGSGVFSTIGVTARSPLVLELATGLSGRGDALVLQGGGGQLGEGGGRGPSAGDGRVQSEDEHPDHQLGIVRGGEADEGGGVGAVADLRGARLAAHGVAGHGGRGGLVVHRVVHQGAHGLR